eukprot:SAG31_NODE_251_length_19069_cov_5.843226_3_plen_54_part_00
MSMRCISKVDGKTTEGQTCMHFAVMWGYERHISALLEHGANVNVRLILLHVDP